MRIRLDQKNDALYLRLDEAAIVDSEEVRPGVILDYDENDNVVGIEMLVVCQASLLGRARLLPSREWCRSLQAAFAFAQAKACGYINNED